MLNIRALELGEERHLLATLVAFHHGLVDYGLLGFPESLEINSRGLQQFIAYGGLCSSHLCIMSV